MGSRWREERCGEEVKWERGEVWGGGGQPKYCIDCKGLVVICLGAEVTLLRCSTK